MEQTLGSITRNVTTTQQAIDLAKLFNSADVVCLNSDEDNNVFFQPNPNSSVITTEEEEITPTGADGLTNEFEVATLGDIDKFAVGDLIRVTDTDGVVYDTLIESVDVDSTTFTIKPITGHTIAGTDTITVLCYKLPNYLIIKSSRFIDSKFLVKHKTNTDTGLYQLTFVNTDNFSNSKAPFFFARQQ